MDDSTRRACGSSEGGAIGREAIMGTITTTLEPLSYVYALWEGGAVAFGRSDRWSDIDLYADADDDRAEDVLAATEAALAGLSQIELKYMPPVPPQGHYLHAVYRLKDTAPWLLVDLAVIKHSSGDKFLEPEIHGCSRFIFNKGGAIKCPPADRARLAADMKAALARTRLRFDLLGCFVVKEIARGNYIEALDIYQRLFLGSLVEALRAKHDPLRYNFGPRYLRYCLPAEVVARLTDLYFVKDPRDLETKHREAEAWFRSVMLEIDRAP